MISSENDSTLQQDDKGNKQQRISVEKLLLWEFISNDMIL